MQVYIEFALLENFCMDFTLLYCAKLVCGNRAGWKRISLASAAGACFAVLFPLIPVGAVWAAVIKAISGVALCLVAGRFGSVKAYIKFAAVFALFSAVLAGALTGIFMLTGAEYAEGKGYILSSVPVGIPMFGALLAVLAARLIKNRFFKGSKKQVECNISFGGRSVSLKGFFDSGNKVYLRGEPVSVIPESAAKKLIGDEKLSDGVKIHTVAGSKTIKVFTADRLEITGEKKTVYNRVKIGISPTGIDCAVLHPDILED